jgi:CRISPR-associated protein Cas5d
MTQYIVRLEISGPTAMWTRPDTGDAPVSYPAPTFSAAKGIFESVLLSHWAEVVPTRAEICSPIVYHTYTTNYGGPLRKAKIMKTAGSYQLLATALVDVCYRLYARIDSNPSRYHLHGGSETQGVGTTNGAHAYAEMFERRLSHGELYSTPFLGWKEFTPDYVGPIRPGTSVREDVNLVIPSMLWTCFPTGRSSAWQPQFRQTVKIEKGVLTYVE